MSLYGARFVKQLQEEEGERLSFKENGYLFLAAPQGEATLGENHAVQRREGVSWIDLLSPAELAQHFPWLRTDDLALASLGRENEGWMDPWLFLQALKRWVEGGRKGGREGGRIL